MSGDIEVAQEISKMRLNFPARSIRRKREIRNRGEATALVELLDGQLC